MTATLATVSTVELTNAVINMKSRAWMTATTFSKKCHSVGSEKSSALDSSRLFPAVTTMKMNGTMNTTIEATIANAPREMLDAERFNGLPAFG